MLALGLAGQQLVATKPILFAALEDQFWMGIGHLVATGLLGILLCVAALWAVHQARN